MKSAVCVERCGCTFLCICIFICHSVYVLLTIGLPYSDDQLRVEGLPEPLGVDQLHGAVLQAALNVGEDGLIPRVQHQLGGEGG